MDRRSLVHKIRRPDVDKIRVNISPMLDAEFERIFFGRWDDTPSITDAVEEHEGVVISIVVRAELLGEVEVAEEMKQTIHLWYIGETHGTNVLMYREVQVCLGQLAVFKRV